MLYFCKTILNLSLQFTHNWNKQNAWGFYQNGGIEKVFVE